MHSPSLLPHAVDMRRVAAQCLALAAIVCAGLWVANTLNAGMQARGAVFGLDFLHMSIGASTADSIVPLDATDTVLRGMLVGGINTVVITLLGCLAATAIGFMVGALRLWPHPLLQGLAGAYVHTVRNTPLLLQILLWYALLLRLPAVTNALSLGDVAFLSQRGLQLPGIAWHAWGGLPLPVIDLPSRQGFNFVGGVSLSPELVALLCGLSCYSGAFIAEALRGGINAVPVGQWEAAHGVGLSRIHMLRFVILPQALRGALPAMTSQYAGVMKASSLAIVLGYPDLLWVLSTAIHTYGRELEGSLLILGGYLLPTTMGAWWLNRLNSRLVARGAA